jgi:hypothetical protein
MNLKRNINKKLKTIVTQCFGAAQEIHLAKMFSHQKYIKQICMRFRRTKNIYRLFQDSKTPSGTSISS